MSEGVVLDMVEMVKSKQAMYALAARVHARDGGALARRAPFPARTSVGIGQPISEAEAA